MYSNTLQNGALFRALCLPGQRVLSHVHELAWWLDYRTPARDLAYTKDVTSHFIACSRVTLENLVSTQGVSPQQITLCHAFIAINEDQVARARAARQATRKSLGISPDALVVAGVGTLDWRKEQSSSSNSRPWSSDASPTQKFTFSGRGVRLPERPGEGS